MILRVVVWFFASGALLAGCVGDPDGPNPNDEMRRLFDLVSLGSIPYPPDNPPIPERITLGRLLFYDPVLGGERDVACGTCHHPDFAFADGRQFGAGVSGVGLGPQRTVSQSAVTGQPIDLEPRNTPTIFNSAFASDLSGQPSHLAPMFWDGRAVGLEGQATKPIASRSEMRGDAFPGTDAEAAQVAIDSILERLRAISEYVTLFGAAFPDEAGALPVGDPQVINESTLQRAIGAFQRELVTRNSPYDRFVEGDDNALSEIQKTGLELFNTRAKCFVCHRGPMLSNYQFMVTGSPQAGVGKDVLPGDDTGREEHTGNVADRYRFRVPSLRNVELTSPYMHAGAFTTLHEVVNFYSNGGRPRHPSVADDMMEMVLREPIGLTAAEIDAVVEFLLSFTDPGTLLPAELMTVPASVPSGLTPVLGVGTAGATR